MRAPVILCGCRGLPDSSLFVFLAPVICNLNSQGQGITGSLTFLSVELQYTHLKTCPGGVAFYE